MTHKQLVKRISTWLRNSKKFRCSVVASELVTKNREVPDVIGWHGNGTSVLVECKMSRADFIADKNKTCRLCTGMGMGERRYYATPVGVLQKRELPEGWGLLEVDGRYVSEIVAPCVFVTNKNAEIVMLMSVIRRLEISTAVFVRQDDETGIEQNGEIDHECFMLASDDVMKSHRGDCFGDGWFRCKECAKFDPEINRPMGNED